MKILTFLQRGYWLHLLLLIVLALQVASARRAHKTDADIDVMVESGDPQERVYGLHLKASRGVPRFTRNDVVPMLRSDEPLVRELMMTSNMMRFRNVRVRMNEMQSWSDAAMLLRSEFLLNYRIGNFASVTYDELQAFLDAGAGEP